MKNTSIIACLIAALITQPILATLPDDQDEAVKKAAEVQENDQQNQTSFVNREFTEYTLEKDVMVIRFFSNSPHDVPLGQYFVPLPLPAGLTSPKAIQSYLNLPSGSGSDEFVMLKIKAGTTVRLGEIGLGKFDKDNLQSPDYKHARPPIELQSKYSIGSSTGSILPLRSPEIFIVPHSQIANDRSSQIALAPNTWIDVKEALQRNDFSKVSQYIEPMRDNSGSVIRGKTADLFSPQPPIPPSGGAHVSTSTNSQAINNTVVDYGTMPGGVVVDVKGRFQQPIYSAAFNSDDCSFIINDLLRYRSALTRDELGQLYNLALRKKPQLAARSQTDIVGVSTDSTIAHALSAADFTVGALLYGYDAQGNSLDPSLLLPGYVNPEEEVLQRIGGRFSSEGKLDYATILALGLQQRFYLNLKAVEFRADEASQTLIPAQTDVEIVHQVLNLDEKVAAERDVARDFPEFVKAVDHLRTNFNAYTQRLPALKKVGEIAEAFAFFRALKAAGVELTNGELLREAGRDAVHLPTMYHDLNKVSVNSFLVQVKKKQLQAMESLWFSFWRNDEEKLKLAFAKLQLALQAYELEKAISFKKEGKGLCAALPNEAFADPALKEIKRSLPWMYSTYIGAKMSFANTYRDENEAMSKEYDREAITYFEELARLDPHSLVAAKNLGTLYHNVGDEGASQKHWDKFYDLLADLAEKGDVAAQYRLAQILYNDGKIEEAMALYEKAAQQKDQEAIFQVALDCIYNPHAALHGDVKHGFELLKKLAEEGMRQAQYEVGAILLMGRKPIAQDATEAAIWLQKAADQAHYQAMCDLALMYYYGEGVEEDVQKSLELYRKAAANGHQTAMGWVAQIEEELAAQSTPSN